MLHPHHGSQPPSHAFRARPAKHFRRGLNGVSLENVSNRCTVKCVAQVWGFAILDIPTSRVPTSALSSPKSFLSRFSNLSCLRHRNHRKVATNDGGRRPRAVSGLNRDRAERSCSDTQTTSTTVPEEGHAPERPELSGTEPADRLASDLPPRPAWIEINLRQLKRNFQIINHDKPAALEILCVVKDEAYGHGALRVAQTALKCGARYEVEKNLSRLAADWRNHVAAGIEELTGQAEQ
jgi:hypothetical protein